MVGGHDCLSASGSVSVSGSVCFVRCSSVSSCTAYPRCPSFVSIATVRSRRRPVSRVQTPSRSPFDPDTDTDPDPDVSHFPSHLLFAPTLESMVFSVSGSVSESVSILSSQRSGVFIELSQALGPACGLRKRCSRPTRSMTRCPSGRFKPLFPVTHPASFRYRYRFRPRRRQSLIFFVFLLLQRQR